MIIRQYAPRPILIEILWQVNIMKEANYIPYRNWKFYGTAAKIKYHYFGEIDAGR